MTRVRLLVDLTTYGPGLTVGAEGFDLGHSGGMNDRYVVVRFDSGECLPILWDSLELTDTEAEARRHSFATDREERKQAKLEMKSEQLAADIRRAKALLRKHGYRVLTEEQFQAIVRR